MGLNISPSIWQSYINTILDCLQNKKILQGNYGWSFIIHSFKEFSHGQIGGFVKGIIEKWLKDLPEEMPIVQN